MRCITDMVATVAGSLDGAHLVEADERLESKPGATRVRIADLIDTSTVTVTVDWPGGIPA